RGVVEKFGVAAGDIEAAKRVRRRRGHEKQKQSNRGGGAKHRRLLLSRGELPFEAPAAKHRVDERNERHGGSERPEQTVSAEEFELDVPRAAGDECGEEDAAEA